ncbi:KAP family P-loop domain-containing protein [Nonlabens sp. Hel1_33_55]|uniref:KAP family P-loop NTPase fold protein n=1 Tax=Nonlabens sp. Hel1_33_55 TaxID=1336802 RepID=UPI000875B71A|nr:P-loop NTPase fold protein [Nonlabens sp. Hel1_33_55]SCY00300.1 KAP family P-loop domain-containing protein [Nonlabens sp. Hel1_33_55]
MINISSIIDVPKIASDKDQLGILNYQKGLSNFIKNAQTPLTVAVQGEWGSGKTSLMNSVRHDLCGDGKPFFDIWINTWEYSLLNDEYTTMTQIIKGIIVNVVEVLEKDKNQNVENLKRKAASFFGSVAKTATKAAANYATAGMAGDVTDQLFDKNENRSSLRELHSELQAQINQCVNGDNSINGFLFFIDDLDRINPPVAVQILELLKNIFDLENCIFLLAIDYEVVVKGLEPKFGKKTQENEREFRSFFEKIIQLPFSMPIGQYRVNDLIIDNLKELAYFKEEDFTEQVQEAVVEFNNLTVGSNPRSIKRLLNSLSLVKNISQSVDDNQDSNAFEQLINIGVFSIQISYPLVYKALERYPEFDQWDDELAESFKLKALEPSVIEQFKTNQYFDEPWEQILYRICQRDLYLSNRAMQISRLLNKVKDLIEDNAGREENKSQDVSLKDVMSNAIQIAAVTSYNDTVEESTPNEIHKSNFLKSLRNKIKSKLIEGGKDKNFDILYNQSRVQSNLTFQIKKDQHHYRLDISIHPEAKHYRLNTRYSCWYYVKNEAGSLEKNLELETSKSINAKQRFEEMKTKLAQLDQKEPVEIKTKYWDSINDHHSTINIVMDLLLPNAWVYINDDENIEEFLKYLFQFLEATRTIKIGND